MYIYMIVSCLIGLCIGVIGGAYFHEWIFDEED